MKRLLSLPIFLLLCASAHGQCTAGLDPTSVQTAITAASPGGTVTLPAGSCAWTSGVSISGKGITVAGAGAPRYVAYVITSSPLTLGTGTLNLTVTGTTAVASSTPPSLKPLSTLGFTNGQTLNLSELSFPANFMQGTVTSWTPATGALVLNITSSGGTCGTHGQPNSLNSNCKRWLLSTVLASSTVITNNDATALFTIAEDTSVDTDVHGIQFNAGTGSTVFLLNRTASGKAILLHDMMIHRSNNSGITVDSTTSRGVLWNVSADCINGCVSNTSFFRIQDNGTTMSNSWTTASTMGIADSAATAYCASCLAGQNNFYIESSDFHAWILSISDYGDDTRAVFRYNFMNNSGSTSHGADTGNYGNRHFELYNNIGVFQGYTDLSTAAMNWWQFQRGGIAVIHDNIFPAISSQDYGTKNDINFAVENLTRNAGPHPCWGTGTTGGAKYWTPRQIGMGRVTGTGSTTAPQASCPSPTNCSANVFGPASTDAFTYVGDSEPDYFWNNQRSSGGGNILLATGTASTVPDCTSDLQSNYVMSGRDFFNTLSTAKPSYTPFTYPHPLTGGSSPAPVLSFNPNPAAFGNQNVNTLSSPITVTVSNIGTASETYSSIVVSPSVFVNANTGLAGQCAASGTIAVGANCTVKVTFTPTAVQSYSGTLTVTGTVSAAGALTGAGTNAISIPAVPGGFNISVSGSAITLVWNTATGTPTGYTLSKSTVSGGPYSTLATLGLVNTYTDSGLAPGTYYYVIQAFNSAGSSPNSPQATATVVATTPSANLSPVSVPFGNVTLGFTSDPPGGITLTSNGTATLSSIVVADPSLPDFVQTNNCPSSLSVNASCTINVTFTPTATGPQSATICVTSNDPNSPDCITLTGTGVAANSVSPTSLSFPGTFVNKTSQSSTATFTNNSGSTITFSSIAVSGGDSTQFVKGTDACGASVANGASCTVAVTLQPTSAGSKNSALVFTFTGAGGSPISVALKGTSKTHHISKSL